MNRHTRAAAGKQGRPHSSPESRRPSNPAALRLGRIGYLNVLPVYHGLECGAVACDYELIPGPPAVLNSLMAEGQLLAASTSSIEYARRPERYLLLRDLAIAGDGPIRSVLLLSRLPLRKLTGRSILVSPATHTSVALLRLLFTEYCPLPVLWKTGIIPEALAGPEPPDAFLTIGDEALLLRRHPGYPHCLDLGEAWRRWTGLPFVFGLWAADRSLCAVPSRMPPPDAILRQSLDWGLSHMGQILDTAEKIAPALGREELETYFHGLSYTLGEREQQGLLLFWEKLARTGEITAVPPLRFL
jgi:chorismate dehydratase